jgi:ribonucleoside-diphosphate reductase alpha chain
LGSLVLPNFITGTINTNWKKLEETIKLAVRFLDDVIEVNKYVLKDIDIKAHNSRRIGLGVMGLAEYLFAKKLKYGSPKAIAEIERLMRFIRDVTYETLVELAEEKGAFPKFDPIPYGKASFIRKLPASLRMAIKKKGVRCVTGLAIAPTGTISLIADATSGIEPLFRKAYMRHDRVGSRMYVHPLYKDFLLSGDELPDWYVDTDDLNPSDHFEVQVAVQKYVDGAVSKTINMPAGTTTDQLSSLMLEYIHDLKGVTVYVDGCREGQILNPVLEEEVLEYLEKSDTSDDMEVPQCATGVCEL